MNKYGSLIAKILMMLWIWREFPDGPVAITIGQTTYYSCHESEVDDGWRAHEDQHKKQYKRYGFAGFMARYAWYLARYGYKNNPLEIEAEEAKAKVEGKVGNSSR